MTRNILDEVSAENLKHDLFYLCREPFVFRTVSYTAPWHEKNSLDEVDDFLAERCLALPGVRARKIPNKIRPFRCDRTKNIHHWYDLPRDDDPWFDAASVEAVIPGKVFPDEIIQLVSHKDSMSWIESPGAHDNVTGVIANLEVLRILSGLKLKRTVRVLFCNEEHHPWHSRTYAAGARERGDKILAVLNQDSIDGKAPEDRDKMMHTILFSTPEGECLAHKIAEIGKKYAIPLDCAVAAKGRVNDDEGSFIREGFVNAVHNIGSFPYADPDYHRPGDVPEKVNIENVRLSTQLVLTAVLEMAEEV